MNEPSDGGPQEARLRPGDAALLFALMALAQATRLSIFRWLIERGPVGVPARTLAQRADISMTALQLHLRVLEHAGLIEQVTLGGRTSYRAIKARAEQLIDEILMMPKLLRPRFPTSRARRRRRVH